MVFVDKYKRVIIEVDKIILVRRIDYERDNKKLNGLKIITEKQVIDLEYSTVHDLKPDFEKIVELKEENILLSNTIKKLDTELKT